MLQRGRKSSLNVIALDATTTRPKLTAPKLLTKAEAQLFKETAAVNPHLRLADKALLAAYAQAMVKTYRLARQSDTSAWEKSARGYGTGAIPSIDAAIASPSRERRPQPANSAAFLLRNDGGRR
jgi:hypothetical protein